MHEGQRWDCDPWYLKTKKETKKINDGFGKFNLGANYVIGGRCTLLTVLSI